MAWTVKWRESALRDLGRLDRSIQRDVLRYLRERIETDENPRRFGKALAGNLTGLWRYRVGAYRVVCRIEDDRVVVFVIAVGHRSDVYRLSYP